MTDLEKELFRDVKELLGYTCAMCPTHECNGCPVEEIRIRILEAAKEKADGTR